MSGDPRPTEEPQPLKPVRPACRSPCCQGQQAEVPQLREKRLPARKKAPEGRGWVFTSHAAQQPDTERLHQPVRAAGAISFSFPPRFCLPGWSLDDPSLHENAGLSCSRVSPPGLAPVARYHPNHTLTSQKGWNRQPPEPTDDMGASGRREEAGSRMEHPKIMT